MEKDRLPHWDLGPIYPSVDSNEFKADLARIYELKDVITGNLESFSIAKLLSLLSEAGALVSNTSSYASAILSTNTSESAYMKAVNDAEAAENAYQEAWQAFVRSASFRRDEFSSPELKDYSFELLKSFLVAFFNLIGDCYRVTCLEFRKGSYLFIGKCLFYNFD